eukprot:s1739_g7.t1
MAGYEKEGPQGGAVKRFNGEDEDPGKQLKKWRTWALAKMMTIKDLTKAQRAPWLLTLLDGKAWDACEHLSLEQLADETEGEPLLWKTLQERFPEKEQHDMMGEILGEVFALAALDQETTKQWTARVKETFEKCERRAQVKFPSQARGWITLHCAGLSEQEKAIVKAKTQGNLEFDAISAAMRSCFPLYRASGKKKQSTVLQAELDDDGRVEASFDDVEAFLAEHDALFQDDVKDADEQYSESEAAEALAVSWKERRKEIAKYQQSRQFGNAGKSRRSFRIEVEELKKKTKCRRCGRVGHWARECKAPPSDNAAASSQSTAVNYVAVEQGDEQVWDSTPAFVGATEAHEVLQSGLVQSPGYGVVDSGCGRTLIGRNTLTVLQDLIQQRGFGPVKEYQVENVFRFGNGSVERSQVAVRIPVGVAQQFGIIDAAVIAGNAPLLIGRPTLEKMKACINFDDGSLHFLDTKAKMTTNSAGQVLIDILDYPAKQPSAVPQDKVCHDVDVEDNLGDIRGCRRNGDKRNYKQKVTLKKKECRCLLAQWNAHQNRSQSKLAVAELFSPPRFTKLAEQRGLHGKSYDIKQGIDLEDPQIQKQVDAELDELKPDLLVACPPCTHRGGWDHINRLRRSPLETARLIRKSRKHVAFCVQQIRKQVKRGGDFMFEHPWPSEVWNDKDMVPLKRKYGVKRVDMCAYGLKCPDSQVPIQKATGIMCHFQQEAAESAFRLCPGCPKHRPIEGKLLCGSNVSTFCAEYTSQFVRTMFDLSQKHRSSETPDGCAAVDLMHVDECLAGEPVSEAAAESTVAAAHPPSDASVSRPIELAIKKLHVNLGHPSTKDMLRILRHSNASAEAIKAAQQFECSVCKNHTHPASQLPAKTSRIMEFNEKVGMDIKYLPGWKVNQRVPCINIVDYSTSLQIMAPIFDRESAEVTKGVFRDSWLAWAGPPKVLELDSSSSNLSDALGEFCEAHGIDMQHIAADAHWQLGKVERHGHWFSQIFERVADECRPTTAEEFVDCVLQTQTAKNALISESGASPYQLVFGRNPRIPQDLLQDDVHVPASDAVLADAGYQRSQAVRQSARLAVLQCQDSKALRLALRARPRPRREFVSGDWVYYWRSQKWQNGVLLRGGRWHGAGLILGRLGTNWIVAHRRSLLRCSPEHLRLATGEEKTVAQFDTNELLGIKNLLEKGQFPKGQFVDLVNQETPQEPEQVMQHVQQDARARTAAELIQPPTEAERPDVSAPEEPSEGSNVPESGPPGPYESTSAGSKRMPPPGFVKTEEYGPIRMVRHSHKSPPEYLIRPPVMEQDDFAEMMQEVIPQLIEEHVQNQPSENQSSSPRGSSTKREASQEADRPSVRARLDSSDVASEQQVLSVEVAASDLTRPIEVLMAGFLQKRAQKELTVGGHSPEVQQKIDESKTIEWETLMGKQAIKIWTGAKAKQIREKQGHRFIGSRFVVVNKSDEDGDRIKSRWCLQGHLDPDFKEKLSSGMCHSPTLHQLSRALVLQLLVSNKWLLQLGDIKGAFLEAGPINPKFVPLYAHQPAGGVPGLDSDDVIEVTGNVYGSNDAPFNWWHTFDAEVCKGRWQRSQFDSCLYFLYEPQQDGQPPKLCGVLGAHVDDTITGGQGPTYEAAIAQLKKRFPYRKWRQGNGEFCGVTYNQNPETMEISFQQKEYAQHMRPIPLSKERLRNKEALATDREMAALRAINGAANWLSTQSRPDICVQTSFSQQCFPKPKVKDLLYANQLVHRAKQYSGVEITVKYIPLKDLCICFHSDAGFGNAKANSTQAGYTAAFSSMKLADNEASPWSPFAWKSYKLPRKVASTLAGEAQAYSTATAVCEWMSLMLAEAIDGKFDLRASNNWQDTSAPTVVISGLKLRDQIRKVPIIGVTDCKSLYDNLTSMSSVSKTDDKRVAIDIAIVKQSMSRCGLVTRWCPTELMLADGLTKDQLDPADLLRSILHLGEYQLHSEASVLDQKKKLREERDRRKVFQMQFESQQLKYQKMSRNSISILSLIVMSSSEAGSKIEIEQAVMVINILRQSGLWETAIRAADQAEVQAAAASSAMTSGPMHDGSKRRCPSPPSELTDDADFEHISESPEADYSKQAPVVPSSKGPIHEMLKKCGLPEGIKSISHWGKTICTLPKVAHRRVTYEALVKESKTDSETKSYLNWVVSSNMKSAKLDDLKGYLQAIKYSSAGEGIVNYPGTNSIREFGS